MATSSFRREVGQTWSFRGSKSRNKVSVGEPAEGSLKKEKRPVFFIRMGSIPLNRVYIPLLLWQAALGRRLRLIVPARGPKLYV